MTHIIDFPQSGQRLFDFGKKMIKFAGFKYFGTRGLRK